MFIKFLSIDSSINNGGNGEFPSTIGIPDPVPFFPITGPVLDNLKFTSAPLISNDGNTIIFREDSEDYVQGVIRVYKKTAEEFELFQTIIPPRADFLDLFGQRITLHANDTVLFATQGFNGNNGTYGGFVRYVKNVNGLFQEHSSYYETERDESGWGVTMPFNTKFNTDGTRGAADGFHLPEGANAPDVDIKVNIFVLTGTTWSVETSVIVARPEGVQWIGGGWFDVSGDMKRFLFQINRRYAPDTEDRYHFLYENTSGTTWELVRQFQAPMPNNFFLNHDGTEAAISIYTSNYPMLSETETGLQYRNFDTDVTTFTSIPGLGVYTGLGAFAVASKDLSKVAMVGYYSTPSENETEDYTVTKGALHLLELINGTYVHTKSFEDLETGVARYGEGYGNWSVLSNNGSKLLLAHDDSYILSEGTHYYGVLSL